MNENIDAIETTDQIDSNELLDEMTDEELDNLVSQPVKVELTLEQIVDQVLEASKKTEFTMYAIATSLNLVLEAIGATKNGSDYRVRPQMIYNYNRNKMVAKDANGKGIQLGDTATLSQVRAFIIKVATKFI